MVQQKSFQKNKEVFIKKSIKIISGTTYKIAHIFFKI